MEDIATRAGVTKRTFSRHFSDKREVLFGGGDAFRQFFVDSLAGAPASATPLEAIAVSLEAVGGAFRDRSDFARRRHAVIAANAELQERELVKLASVAAALAQALRAGRHRAGGERDGRDGHRGLQKRVRALGGRGGRAPPDRPHRRLARRAASRDRERAAITTERLERPIVAATRWTAMLRAVGDLDRVRLRLDRVRAAVGAIDPAFLDTPALTCGPLGRALGCSITLKIETLNPVRSFKARGTETVADVAREHGASRVVCASAGNLGQALAYSGRHRGLEVTGRGGAEREPAQARPDRRPRRGPAARRRGHRGRPPGRRAIADAERAYLVEDSLDLATCEGAATIGLELVRDDPQLDVVLLALGGGALASGVGYVARSLADQVEVIGVQPVGAPAMTLSWRERTVVETDRMETIADGVAGRCPIPEVLDDLLIVLDDVLLVREDSIKLGMRMLHEHAGLVVEPSAALGIAAVLEQPERFAGRRVTTVLCGSNVAPDDFARWVLEPVVADAPG